jgi:signal transduction histidine kinase
MSSDRVQQGRTAATRPFRVGELVITKHELHKRKRYLEITSEDEQRLRAVHEYLVPHLDAMVDRFYDYLLAHEETRRILTATPDRLERLRAVQRQYFLDLTSGHYDLVYLEDRVRVGLAHQRIGLSPEWYLGAFNKYREIAAQVLELVLGHDAEHCHRTLNSLNKVISLDMSLAIDAYVYSAQEKLADRASALEVAHAELRQLGEAKQRLTDMIVHDLRNPLSGIVAFLQILGEREAGLTDQETIGLRAALSRCEDLSHLIMNVLQLSQAERGELPLQIERVDLVELTDGSVSAFRQVAERTGKQLSFRSRAGSLPTRTDEGLLRRVLYNLIRNALQHTPQGTRVEVSVMAGPPFHISVADDGPGIPLALQDRLYEPGALRKAGLSGDSGLGLSFCKMAADALRMRLRVESKPGRGTRFLLEDGEDLSRRHRRSATPPPARDLSLLD